MKTRVFIITGSSRGIGREICRLYRKEYNVIGISRSESSDTDLKLDISEDFSREKMIGLIENYDEIILINCAGITYNSFLHKSDLQKWKDVINTNLIGTYRMIRAVTPLMRQKSFGRIVNFSSVTSQIPTPGVTAYAASKSALWGLSKSFAAENALKGVTMNNINLGYTDLGMINDVPSNFLAEIIDKIPSRKLGNLEQIVSTINYIIDNEYLNGTSIDLNGGLT